MRSGYRHRVLWLTCGALTAGLLASLVGGESVGAALTRVPSPRPAHRRGPSAPSEKPRMQVEVPGGTLRFELSPTDERMSVRREAVRVTIVCSDAYRLLVRGSRLRQDDGERKASPEHLLIRRSDGDAKWARLSSEWVELADEPAEGERGVKHVYTFDVGSDFGEGGSPWVLAGGDYLGGLEFKLRVASSVHAANPPSAPKRPKTPSREGTSGRGGDPGTPPAGGTEDPPVVQPPTGATETVPPPTGP